MSSCFRRNYLLNLLVIFVFALSLACTGGGNDEDTVTSETVLDKVTAATVRILIEGAFFTGGEVVQGQAGGSGFLLKQEQGEGFIVTNNHVVAGSTIRKVFLEGQTEPLDAALIGTSECHDLAVLKVEGDSFTSLEWSEDELALGREVVAVGFPGITGGEQLTLTEGIISTLAQMIAFDFASVEMALFHTAQINSGNSGGPLVATDNGSVVGVNYAGSSPDNAFLAIAANEARQVVQQIIAGTTVASIGINGETLLTQKANSNAVVPEGVVVVSVTPGGLADIAGLRSGDVIIALNGAPLNDPNRGDNYNLGHYCEILRSQNLATDKIAVRVRRLENGAICEGQLNSDTKLVTFDNTGAPQPCPVGPAAPPPPPGNNGGNGDGGDGGNDGDDVEIPSINEVEPNNTIAEAQVLDIASPGIAVTGNAAEGEAAIGIEQSATFGEDLFQFTVGDSVNLTILLLSDQGDFDLYIANDTGQIFLNSAQDGIVQETVENTFAPGTYFIVVDAWETVTQPTDYTLIVVNNP